MNRMSDGGQRSSFLLPATRVTFRYLTGAHLDGERRTDAGWLTPGTRHLAGGRVSRWSMAPRAYRAAARWAASGAAAAFVWGYSEHPAATGDTVTGAALAGALAGGYGVSEACFRWKHERDWVKPLHLVIGPALGVPDGTHPRSYIKVPRDYPNREEVGRIDLPPHYTGENRGTVANVVKEKLGLTDVSVTFHMKGRKPHALIKQTPRPPARVNFADVRELVNKAPDSAPLIGIGPRNTTVAVDLDSESPHVLVSASTGGGKSVIARGMTTQALHRGAQAIVLDRKRISHKWARGLSQVVYCRDIEEIHDALVWVGEEGDRRTRVADEWDGDEKDAPVGPRLIVVLEEVNATVNKLKKYWARVRKAKADEDGPADPKESPALDAFADVLFMGRAVKIHIIAVGQSITVYSLGGDPAVRECFGTRILARYTKNAWNMLVPEITVPRMSRHAGRAHVALGGTAHETQVAFFTEDECRDWATSGVVAPPLSLPGWSVTQPVTQGTPTPSTSADGGSASRDSASVTPRLTLLKGGPNATAPAAPAIPPMPTEPPTVAPPVRLYSLAEASREGVVPMKPDALRTAKKRDVAKGEFPAGVNGKYTAEELQRWYRNRPAAPPAASSDA